MGLFDKFKKSEPPEPEGGADLAPLIAGLSDPAWEVRARSAEALGQLGAAAQEAVPALEEAISDEHGDVCLAASDALSRIRAPIRRSRDRDTLSPWHSIKSSRASTSRSPGRLFRRSASGTFRATSPCWPPTTTACGRP